VTGRIDPGLLEALLGVRERAYAPYSGFHVGAAVTTASGRIFFGCNVETAHFKSVCAEASAISAMVAAGERSIARVHVVASGDRPCPPCGDCRQRLFEFGDARTDVALVDESGNVVGRYRLDQLLPDAFGPDRLDAD